MTNDTPSREYPEIDINEYRAVQLQDYKGIFGLLALNIGGGENMTYYKQWIFLSEWNNGKPCPSDKKLPMAVRLGDKETAVNTLEELLKQLKG